MSAESSRRRPPSYRLHRATGQAVVTLNKKDFYLGLHGSPESKEAYNRLVAEWLVSGRQLLPKDKSEKPPTVAEIVAAFWLHAEAYYVGHNGKPTSELVVYQTALRPLVRLYGSQPARNFGPLALRGCGRRW